jgi:hypothetical protein
MNIVALIIFSIFVALNAPNTGSGKDTIGSGIGMVNGEVLAGQGEGLGIKESK